MDRGDYQYVLQYVKSRGRHDPEDIVHSAYLRQLMCPTYRQGAQGWRTWMVSVSIGLMRDSCVKQAIRKKHRPMVAASLPSYTPAVELEESPLIGLRKLVEELPAQYREPIELFYYEELSLAEVAERLATSVASIKARMFRGRALLKERYAC
jgi:RNA polymerase sigma factor (sigma-70 family)